MRPDAPFCSRCEHDERQHRVWAEGCTAIITIDDNDDDVYCDCERLFLAVE
jgi:hypothetical protein